MIGAGLEEFSHPQAAGVARGLPGRQRVIGSDHLVAVGDIGAGPEKQRAVVLHVGEEVIRISRHHLDVLGGDAVGLAHHLLLAVAHDDLAEICPRFAGDVGGGKQREQPVDLAHGLARKLLRIGNEDGGRGRAVLGLAEQIGGADLAVDAVVGDDQRFGRAREQIDADAAEELALGFRHVGVAGPHDHVDGADGLGAQCHGGDRLHAAEHVDVVGAAEVHGGDDGRVRPALERRRAGDDALHARHARGHDRHMRRGDHGIASARHVAADRIHRDVPVTEHDAGQRLDLEIAQRLLLLLREIAHLRLRELDVVEVAFAELRYRALDLGGRQLERGRRPVVEFLRQLAHRRIAPRLDLGEDVFHRLAHLGIGGFDRARVHSALEIAGHGGLRFILRRGRARSGRSRLYVDYT